MNGDIFPRVSSLYVASSLTRELLQITKPYLKNIPYLNKFVHPKQVNCIIVTASIFLAQYVESRLNNLNIKTGTKELSQENTEIKERSWAQLFKHLSVCATLATILQIAKNRLSTGNFSRDSVFPTVAVVCLTPLTRHAIQWFENKSKQKSTIK